MPAVHKGCFYKVGQFQLCKNSLALVVLGGMTKNVYHGIFKIIPVSWSMTVFIFFMHNRVLSTFSTD